MLSLRGRALVTGLGDDLLAGITEAIHEAVLKVPASAWTPALEPDGEIREVPEWPSSPGTSWTAGPRGYG
ncbi:hypothetical protein SGFS_021900 [Streptomyces graminofaciens]|uniref:Uncharacterized protein n=1 Tax=Streptomyces graminofaciens TaxID=68212 RepID=A0ABN5VCG7_9ACTN|nr:hypothetical protein SGFS_021900 [Streptomyces graminofaciens]